MPEFEFERVTKRFRVAKSVPFTAISDIEVTIEPGEFVCLLGPSGCGKTTLLGLAAGLIHPSKGTVRYRGQPISRINTDVGYMTQHDTLLPWRTIEQNVGLALEVRRTPRSARQRRVHEVLELVGLTPAAQRYPSQLSGGMKKRAALAQVLAYSPSSLLMDEPFAALDAQLRVSMQRELLDLWERDRKTVLFVTHDLEEAILLADTIVVFSGSPGTVVHMEKVRFSRPRDPASLRHETEYEEVWERLWRLLRPSTGSSESDS